MNRLMIFSLLYGASLTCMASDGHTVSNPANLIGKEFTNPVIHADYSDPDAVASPDGKTFYMTSSSFSDVPGLPILKSDDLVNWTLVNYALEAVPPVDFYNGGVRHGKGGTSQGQIQVDAALLGSRILPGFVGGLFDRRVVVDGIHLGGGRCGVNSRDCVME